MREVSAEPHAQYTANIQTTVCTTEITTESHSAISKTFHNEYLIRCIAESR